MGHFSFDRPPTTPAGKPYARMVTVSKNVVISGSLDQNGDMPTIEGGEWPFLVDAVDARVTIQGLHFVRPRAGAIWIYAVSGLAVTGCRIESIEPTAQFAIDAGQAGPVSNAIFAGADPHPPSATQLGHPENFSGTLAILNNDIDVGAPPGAQTLGIVMFNVGRSPDKGGGHIRFREQYKEQHRARDQFSCHRRARVRGAERDCHGRDRWV